MTTAKAEDVAISEVLECQIRVNECEETLERAVKAGSKCGKAFTGALQSAYKCTGELDKALNMYAEAEAGREAAEKRSTHKTLIYSAGALILGLVVGGLVSK